jgi:hypothetical protein
MKSSIVPVSCGVVLTAISAAGLSHWFSVREMVIAYQIKPPLPLQVAEMPAQVRQPLKPGPEPTAAPTHVVQAPAPDSSPANALGSKPAEDFFRTLLSEFKELKEENRTLQNQLEETNRDIMSMQFRLDTHSSEFRPLPSANELRSLDSSQDFDNGVLAPLDPLPLPAN